MICGIDPMDKGALAFLDHDFTEVIDMPTVKITQTRHEFDAFVFIDLIGMRAPDRIYVEKMQPMPIGSLANFKRGGYLYAIRAVSAALKVSLVEVPPKEWQKAFGIKSSRKGGQDTKEQSYLVAKRMFPDIALKTPKDIILDGRCDALLIAEYGRRVKDDERGGR